MPSSQESQAIFNQRFVVMNDDQLVDAFNREVGNPGWVSTRAIYLAALAREFERRGYDYSAIGDEASLSFRRKIKLVKKVLVPIQS